MSRRLTWFALSLIAACGQVTSNDADAPVGNDVTLTVSASGNGSGTVTSQPAGIDCGAMCTGTFAAGTSVTLDASPAAGSAFLGWSGGGGCSGTAPCTITLGADTTVTAMFALGHTLMVTVDGTGAGTVTSAPAGINCGSDCSEQYVAGTQVTLTAGPSGSSTFTGWGGACSGTSTCMVTVDSAVLVTATFAINQHVLDVARAGNGAGTVTSSPAGIDCGMDCTETYDEGTVVTLTASPSTGSGFTGWAGGGCTGPSTSCVVSITAAATVTATFTLDQYTLTVARNGAGTGTVTSNPAGINCGTDCDQAYNYNTSVVLTAVPSGTSAFLGWSGACMGTGTCTVVMSAARAVTATFGVCPTGTTTFSYTGGLQTFTVPGCVTSVTIDARGAQGGDGGALGGVGGRGARAQGTFAVAGGSQLTILVGGRGLAGTDPGEQAGGTGGGGSFVVNASGQPMIIAGGGGGAMGRSGLVVDGGPGQAGTAGAAGQTNGGAGGVNGNGGATWPWLGWHSGTGGGGFLTNGVNDSNGNPSYGTINQSGRAYVNGGAGGLGGSLGRNGGYGGGGSAGFTGGGGGGYSGGGSGTHDAPGNPNGGGGGSYNSGTSPTNTAGFNTGNGAVIISW
jgi:hypothetical protein